MPVGIVDTGIDSRHEDLVGKTVACAGVKNFGVLGIFGVDDLGTPGRDGTFGFGRVNLVKALQ